MSNLKRVVLIRPDSKIVLFTNLYTFNSSPLLCSVILLRDEYEYI